MGLLLLLVVLLNMHLHSKPRSFDIFEVEKYGQIIFVVETCNVDGHISLTGAPDLLIQINTFVCCHIISRKE